MKAFNGARVFLSWFQRSGKFSRLPRSYLMVILLPMLMCVVLFIGVYVMISGQVRDVGELTVQHFQAGASSMLNEIELIMASLSRDKSFVGLLEGETPPDFTPERYRNYYVNEIDLRLRDYRFESSYIERLLVFSGTKPYIFTSGGVYTDDSREFWLGKIGETPLSFYGDESKYALAGWHMGSAETVAPYYSLPLYASDNSEIIGNIVVILNMTHFKQSFSVDSIALSCMFDENYYISSRGAGQTSVDWLSDSDTSAFLSEDVKTFHVETDDFTYMVAIPLRFYYRHTTIIALGFGLYLLGMLLWTIAYSLRAAKRHYDSAAALIDKLPNQTGEVSSYEEIWNVVQSALEHYRDNVSLMRMADNSRNIRCLLLGYNGSENAEKSLNEAGILLACAGYYVVTFFIDDYADMFFDGHSVLENYSLARVVFRSTIASFAENRVQFAFCSVSNNTVAVFSVEREENAYDEVLEITKKTVDLIEKNYGLNIRTAISSRTDSLTGLAEAYSETLRLNDLARSVNDDIDLISGQELYSDKGALVNGDFIKQVQALINTLLAEHYDMMPQMVRGILNQSVASMNYSYLLIKTRLSSVSTLLAESVMTSRVEGFDTLEASERLRSADSVSSLIQAADDVFDKLHKGSSLSSAEDLVGRACRYIQENYHDSGLSVLNICDALGISIQHLSRVFRQKMDTTLTEYLTMHRVKIAKELLASKKMTVQSIAQAVGYNSTITFSRNFKKLEGVNPSDYWNLI